MLPILTHTGHLVSVDASISEGGRDSNQSKRAVLNAGRHVGGLKVLLSEAAPIAFVQLNNKGHAMGRTEKVNNLVTAECEILMPQTQEDCCAIVARVTIRVRGYPKTDKELMALSVGMAQGLFGEAFDIVSEGQRHDWIEMCEHALRAAAKL